MQLVYCLDFIDMYSIKTLLRPAALRLRSDIEPINHLQTIKMSKFKNSKFIHILFSYFTKCNLR